MRSLTLLRSDGLVLWGKMSLSQPLSTQKMLKDNMASQIVKVPPAEVVEA